MMQRFALAGRSADNAGLLNAARQWPDRVWPFASVGPEITRLREFEALLREFGDVTVIWAHGGYTPLFLARRLMLQHPNLIYELSARTWARHPRSPDYTIFQNETVVWREWLQLIEEMPTRFVIGTDAASRSESGDADNIRRVIAFLSQLNEQTREHVSRTNLRRLLEKPKPHSDH